MSTTTVDAESSATRQAMARVAELDFTMLKKKLARQKRWTAEFIDETEQLYRQFLALFLLYPERKISPTHAIDEFWHAHILDTRAYAADCEALFGKYRHHYPYSGMTGVFDEMMNEGIRAESRALFKQHFGIDPFDRAARATDLSAMRASVAVGARVEGVDLAGDIGDDIIDKLRELMLEHHVLVLPRPASLGPRTGRLRTQVGRPARPFDHPAPGHRPVCSASSASGSSASFPPPLPAAGTPT